MTRDTDSFKRLIPVLTTVCCGVLLLSGAPAMAQTAAAARPPAPPDWTLEVSNDFTNPGGGQVDQNETDIRVTRQVDRRSTLFLEVDQHNRYNDLDTGFLVGAGHAFGAKHLFLVSASLALGFNDPVIIPKREYEVKGSLRATPKLSPVFAFDRQYYSEVHDLNKLTAGVNLTPNSDISIQPVYVVTSASIAQNLTATGQAFGLQASVRTDPRFAFIFKGGYGHEHAMAHRVTVVELVRTIKELDLEPGIDLKVSRNRDLKLSYTYENKHTLYSQHGFIIDFVARF